MRAAWGGLLIAVLLAGCASNPDQTIYIMSPPVSGNGGVPGGLALLVRPVVLPDYLDTTDLITRTGPFDVVASRTGRWGERLSQGITRTLAADLSHRLGAYAAADGAAATPALQIEVKVSAFDVTAGAAVLAASWAVVWPDDGRPPVISHATFAANVAQPGSDQAKVAAMAEAVAELSGSIAATAQAHK